MPTTTPGGSFNYRVGLDSSGVTQSLRSLREEIKSTTSSWKAQSVELKSAGDALGAAKAKFEGLSQTVEKQNQYLDGYKRQLEVLQTEQQKCDTSTDAGKRAYESLESQIAKTNSQISSAATKLASLSGQQERAKNSVQYYESGLASAQSKLRSLTESSNVYIQRLEAEGKTEEANKAKLTALSESYGHLNQIYQIQQSELKRIEEESGKTSEAYRNQEIRVNKTATSLAKTKSEMSGLSSEMNKANPSVFDRIKAKLIGVNGEATKTHSLFKTIFSANFLSNGLSNLMSSAWSGLKNTISEGMELDGVLAKVNGKWTAMGKNAADIESLDTQMTQLKGSTSLTGDEVNRLQTQMDILTHGKTEETEATAKGIAAIGLQSKISGDATVGLAQGLTKALASGKLTNSQLGRLEKQAPALGNALAKAAGVSQDQFTKMVDSGKISSAKFMDLLTKVGQTSGDTFKKFQDSAAGSQKRMETAWDSLKAKMSQPLFDMKKSAMKQLADLMSSKPVQDGAKMIGDSIRTMAVWGMKILQYVGNHKSDITAVASDIVTITKGVAAQVWKDFIGIISNIEKSFGLIDRHSKDSADPMHQIRVATDGIAKNQTAIKLISDSIIAIATVKGLSAVTQDLQTIAGLKVGKGSLIDALKDGISGQKFDGAFQSVKAAGGWSSLLKSSKNGGMTTAGKLLFGATAVFDGVDIAKKFYNAIHSNDATQKFQQTGSGIGGMIGASLGGYFGGPVGMHLGELLGTAIGKKAGDSAKKWLDGWNAYNKKHKPDPIKQPIQYQAYDTHRGYDQANKYAYKGKPKPKNWWDALWNVPSRFTQYKPLNSLGNAAYDFQAFSNNEMYMAGHNFHNKKFDNEFEKSRQSNNKLYNKKIQDWIKSLNIDWGLSDYIKKLNKNTPKLPKFDWKRVFNFGSSKPLQGKHGIFEGFIDTKKLVNDLTKPLKNIRWPKIKLPKLDTRKMSKDWDRFWKKAPKDLKTNWSKIIKNAENGTKNLKKNIDSYIKKSKKSWSKHWSDSRKTVITWAKKTRKEYKKGTKYLEKSFKTYTKQAKKSWDSHWKKLNKSVNSFWSKAKGTSSKGTKKLLKTTIDYAKKSLKEWKKHHQAELDAFHDFQKNLKKDNGNLFDALKDTTSDSLVKLQKNFSDKWSAIRKDTGKKWDDMKSNASTWGKNMNSWFNTFGKNWSKGWNNLSSGTRKIFDTLWKQMKKLAKDSINGLIDIVNGGISAVDWVINKFGGGSETVKHVKKLATGTGYFGSQRQAITEPTLAVVNDGHDSPETGNKEALFRPATGEFGIFQGRNTPTMLMPGDEVLNATETKLLMQSAGFTHFAKGTGFLGSVGNFFGGIGNWAKNTMEGMKKFFEKAKEIISHPQKALDDIFKWTGVKGLSRGAFHEMITKGFNKGKSQVNKFWSTLWSMVSGSLDGGGAEGGLLGAVEKYGKGHPYVWGAAGPDAFDCSGLVMYALEHAFGKSFPHYSGSQYAATVGVKDPQPGDLVFFGPGGRNHVGVYAGNGKYWSAMSPSASPNIGMSDVSSGPGEVSYRRVPGLKGEGASTSVKATNGLQKFIKSLPGMEGFFKFIGKLGSMFGIAADAKDPAGTGADRWGEDIKAAAAQMHVSVSNTDIAKIIDMIRHESGGNAQITQSGADPDGDGSGPARGLLQFKTGTFNHYKVRGHGNIYHGWDQLLALFNDSNWRSDIHWGGGWGPSGHRRYANGGIATQPSIFGEAGPEMAIPLSAVKSSRSYELLGKTAAIVAARDNVDASQAGLTGALEKKIDALITSVQLLVQMLGDETEIKTTMQMDGHKVGQITEQYVSKAMAHKMHGRKVRFSGR